MHLSGFIVRIHRNARSAERQKRDAFNIVINFHLIFTIQKTLVIEHPLSICPISHGQLHILLMSDPHIKGNETEGTYREADSQFGDVFQLHTARA